MSRIIRRYWPLLLPLILFLPGIGGFTYPAPDSPYSDLAIAHYPNALFLKNTLLTEGVIPLWSPLILIGTPFAANPLSGLWYPPGWLALLFPLPLGLNLVVALHVLWGGVGLAAWLRHQRRSQAAAWLGGLAFALLPKLFAHYGAGHMTMCMAVAWTPWLLLAAQKPGGKWYTRPAVVLALIFLADPRWAAYAGLLWLTWEFAHSQSSDWKRIRWFGGQVAVTALLSAPLLLPLLEYTRLSTRGQMTSADVLAFSLEPARLLGLLFPDFGGFHEWMLYPGVLVLFLALAALLADFSRRAVRFWGLVGLLALLYSLGEYVPGMRLLAGLPGFSLLRVPPRALFLLGLALAVLAANGLDALSAGLTEKAARRLRLLLAGLAAFGGALAGVVWVVSGELPRNFLWGALGLGLAWVWSELRPMMGRAWLLVGFALLVVDLGVVDASLFAMRPADAVLAEGAETAAYLAAQPGEFRVYSPSYSLPQQTAAYYGLQLADGIDPLHLAGYAEYMTLAAGVPRTGYSVTVPPLAGENIATVNQVYIPDANLLGLLNVRYVASEFDLEVEGLTLAGQFGETRLYANQFAKRRLWGIGPEGGEVAAEIVRRTPNRIEVAAAGPGRLTLAEINYPGWQIRLDGELTAHDPDQLLRVVNVPAGVHQIEVIFRPLSVYYGLGLAAVGVLLLWRGRWAW